MAKVRTLRDTASVLLGAVGSKTVTMHVRDAWAPLRQYRVFCMHGVLDRAPMFAGIRVDRDIGPSALLDWPVEPNEHFEYLCENISETPFANSLFAAREGVEAFARYQLWVGGKKPDRKRPDVIVVFSYPDASSMDAARVGSMRMAVKAVRLLWDRRGVDPADVDDLLQQTEWMGRIMRETREAMVQDQVRVVIESVFECLAKLCGRRKRIYCGVELYLEESKQFRTASLWHDGTPVHFDDSRRKVWKGGVIQAARKSRRPLFIESVAALREVKQLRDKYAYEAPRDRDGKRLEDMTQEIAAPMYLDGEAIGVLNVEVPKEGRLKAHHVALVEMLADVTAVAIGSSRQDAVRGSMLELVEGVLFEADPSPRVNIIQRAVMDGVPDVSACHFLYWRAGVEKFEWVSSEPPPLQPRTEGDGGMSHWVRTACAAGKYPELRGPMVSDIRKNGSFTPSALLASRGAARGALTVSSDPKYLKGLPRELHPDRGATVKVEVVLPLLVNGQLVGVVWVKRDTARPFGADELTLLSLFSMHASLALYVTAEYEARVEDRLWETTKGATFGAKWQECVTREGVLPKRRPRAIVLNADVRKSAELVDELLNSDEGPEVFVGMMQQLYGSAREIMFRYDGVLTTFMGDGVMGLFGVLDEADGGPTLVAPPAVAGIMAALELTEWLEDVRPSWAREIVEYGGGGRPEFGLGIGLHRGAAVVGDVLHDMQDSGFDFTAVGRAPAVAARVQQLAKGPELGEDGLWPVEAGEPPSIILLCTEPVMSDYEKSGLRSEVPVAFLELTRPQSFRGLAGEFPVYIVRRDV